MLVQQVPRAPLALLVADAFRFRAAKARPVAVGLPGRAIPLGAFPELSQIDGFPHDHLHHPNGRYGTAICKSLRALPINSICIKNPRPSTKPGRYVSSAKA